MTRKARAGAVTAALLSGLAAPASAQAGGQVTLGLAVRSALATHPTIEAARARLDAAESAVGEARASWLPTVGTQGLGTRYEEPMVVAPLHGFDPAAPPRFDRTLVQGHAVAEWTAFDGGARGARIAGARAVASGAESGVEAASHGVIAEAVSSYLGASTADEVARAHGELVRALEAERSRAALLFEAGRIPRVSVLRAEAALSRARADLEAVGAEREVAFRRLARVTGLGMERLAVGLESMLPDAAPPEPAGGAPGSRDALVETALARHPELGRARGRAAAAGAMVDGARSAYLPRIGVAGRYSAFGSAETAPRPEWNAGVQVSWAAFTGGARGRAVDRAEAEARVAEADVALVARQVEEAVDRALAAYRAARARTEALEAAAAQSAEVARIEALALDAGAGVQTDYLRAEAELLQVRAGLAEARSAVLEARVRLAQATGSLTVAWVLELTGEGDR